jgi:hypothetical protein
LLVPPNFVDVFVRHGWTKDDVRDYVMENCKRSLADLKRRGIWGLHSSDFEGFSGLSQEVEVGDEQRYGYVFKPHEYDRMLFDDTSLLHRSDIYVVVGGGNAGLRLCFIAPYAASTDPKTIAVRAG